MSSVDFAEQFADRATVQSDAFSGPGVDTGHHSLAICGNHGRIHTRDNVGRQNLDVAK